MMKTNNEYAAKAAIELAKQNIESTDGWVSPEQVTQFIEEVYAFLTGEDKED
ncbi:hypothetical protein [Paenibacillus vini]|uniref:Phage protein n=1 Tax=Paenibacillus vini TaxID=1476024 RepID=A0ABQ4M8U1_9BACL|nr:hypothetical protein [Paenibacillus vini]GIP51835.1 hypothetical protein J42TS3_08700 [Paenibacillus vini]